MVNTSWYFFYIMLFRSHNLGREFCEKIIIDGSRPYMLINKTVIYLLNKQMIEKTITILNNKTLIEAHMQ
jgi:hypothetical protein